MPPDPRVNVGVLGILQRVGLNGLEDITKRILMMRRADDLPHWPGVWAPPGGWVDFGEHPNTAIIREFKEEVDITIKYVKHLEVVATCLEQQDLHCVTIAYLVEPYGSWDAKIMEPKKCAEVAWLTIEEVLDGRPLMQDVEDIMYTLKFEGKINERNNFS